MRYALIVSAIGLCMISVGCAVTNSTVAQEPSYRRDMVARPGEPDFNAFTGLSIVLPMPESEFLLLVSRTKLRAFRRGPGELIERIPSPKYQDLDLTQIDHAWVLVGETDIFRGVTPYFNCFVNKEGLVVYIENDFAFRPP